MPFKNKKKAREWRRRYMKRYRADKIQLLVDLETLREIERMFPSVYELLMGKERKGKNHG